MPQGRAEAPGRAPQLHIPATTCRWPTCSGGPAAPQGSDRTGSAHSSGTQSQGRVNTVTQYYCTEFLRWCSSGTPHRSGTTQDKQVKHPLHNQSNAEV